MDESRKASSIISKLENYDYGEIHTLFSDLLQPFLTFISPKSQNPSKKKPSNPNPKQSIRSLVKTFLPFISKSLSLIPKRLSESPKHPKTQQFISQLFDSYKLCLDCLDVSSSELSGKPYAVQLQRVRFIHCLLRWERYEEGIDEGFRVLKSLGGVEFGDDRVRVRVSIGKLVPRLVDEGENGDGVEGDFVHLIVDIAVVIVQCVSLSKIKDAGKYTGLLILLDEVRPWFRYLDSGVCDKLQSKLLTYMRNATIFLVREVEHFEGDLVPMFCAATFREHTALLNSQWSQGRVGEELEEFVKFVSNCVFKCRSVCIDVRFAVAMHLHKIAGGFPQGLAKFSVIFRLYAMGLYLSELSFQSTGCCSSDLEDSMCSSSTRLLPEVWDKLQDLSALLRLAKSCYYSDLDDYRKALSFGGFDGKASTCINSEDKNSEIHASIYAESYLSFCLNALKFVCWPLAEFVNSTKKRIVSEAMDTQSGNLKLIQEALTEYCYLFPHCQKEKDPCEEIDAIVLNISGAAFILSLKLNLNMKASKGLINYLLSNKCIRSLQPQRLKHIIAILHNTFVEFYKEKQLKEASKALKLCCRASWCRCLLLCKMIVEKQKGFDGELSDAMIAESVNEACKVNSLLVDILRQIDSDKLGKVMVYSLEKWCVGRSLFERFPIPEALIKNWVKTQCKSYKNMDVSAPVLGYMLLDSSILTKHNVSAEIIGIILEQELLAYQELGNLFPKFSQRMQIEIIDILLQNVYGTNKLLQRSNILVKKGMLLRAGGSGSESLEDCICCLSEAIESVESNMNSFFGLTHEEAATLSCQLAVAYCLRAQCSHEADPKSQELFNDLRKALSLLSRIDVAACSNGQSDMGLEYVLLLLFHAADLLSIKGNTKLHSDVVNVIIKVIKRMNVSLEKCLSLLWGSRRLSHALCVFPVNEAFITVLSEHYGKEVESLDFWMSSMKDCQPLSVGLEQSFSFVCCSFPLAFHQCKHSVRTEISIDEVKEVARHLISNVPMHGRSAFLAGYLYHDLSERLFADGRMLEALLCAKEAHRLRGKLLQQHFSFSFEQCEEKHDDSERTIPRQSVTISNFTILNQVATKVWSNNSSLDLDSFVLTPWIVLQCYLESTLQVGIVHETLGNGAEAEAQFRLGKSISCLQSLPLFMITFSSCLGKVYSGKSLLDLAHKELVIAEQVFAVERASITCSRCSLMLESTINEQLGSLYRRGVQCASENPYELSLKSLISLEKGDLAGWLEQANPLHTTAHFGVGNVSEAEKTKRITEAKKSRRTKKASEQVASVKTSTVQVNSRVTRSRKQSSQNKSVTFVEGVQNVANSRSDGKLEREASIASNKVVCQKCFANELKHLGSFICHIRMKWEFVRRRQILRLLIGLGKCQGAYVGIHKFHIYLKCISILVGGNDCNCLSFPIIEFDFIVNEIPGHILAGERAEAFYYLCWLSLKCLYSKDTSRIHCDACCIQMSQVVLFLKLSFVLSREIPSLFQKVSRLLALIYVVSDFRGNLQLHPSSCNVLSMNFWASYFHQASVGVHQNVRFLSVKHNALMACEVKGFEAASPFGTATDLHTFLRAPESVEEIEACVASFFENLPSSTIVCMSLLGVSYANLLEELLDCPSGAHGWILLSNLNTDDQPVVVLLPLSSVLKDEEMSSIDSIFGEKNVVKEWHTPWGCSSVVDDVAPVFSLILRGNYVSCSSFPEEETDKNREIWWTRRATLDKCLHKLLRDMEESWFGPWKYLLLGRLSDCEPLNSALKELVHEIEARRNLVVNESILKVVMGGIKSDSLEKRRVPWPFLEKGCYIGRGEDCDKQRCSSLDEACGEADCVSSSLIELMLASVKKLEAEYCTRREPVVLVLDSDIQMLPWENMPILRDREVYRMPSVASILIALQQRSVLEEAGRSAAKFPLIDPVDAFYLLNPSGDLNRTQAEFEEWFRLQNIQGKAGVVPSTEELTSALEAHELFLYFGHGSGAQYIPPDKIQKLENCAATLLMGCSSGSLSLSRHYAPVGTSLSYMLAGAPIVVANLWEVTDLDIDRFAKAVLKSFLDERSMSSTGCIQCSILAEEFKSMTVNDKKANSRKGRGKKKNNPVVDSAPDNDISGEYCFRHKLRAGYFISQARKSCKLPYLIGAAPVCYGVPTGIRKKKDI